MTTDITLSNMKMVKRSSDGFINLTELCRAGHKTFKRWMQLEQSKNYLAELSASLETTVDKIIIYESGSNEQRATWAHLQVAINVAQWISPLFAVNIIRQISDSVVSEQETESQTSVLEELLCKDKIIAEQARAIQLQECQIYSLKKRHEYIDREFRHTSGFYIISNGLTQKFQGSDAQFGYKVGKDGSDVVRRFKQHRTSIPAMRIEYLIYINPNHAQLLERAVLTRYRSERAPFANHEFIFGVKIDEIISTCNRLLSDMGIEYVAEDQISQYNSDIDHIISLSSSDTEQKKDDPEKTMRELKITATQIREKQIEHKEEMDRLLKTAQTELQELQAIQRDLLGPMKMKEIRAILEKYGLNPAGQKPVVLDRLSKHVQSRINSLLESLPQLKLKQLGELVDEIKISQVPPPQVPTKICSMCNEDRPLTDYYHLYHSKGGDGYRKRCKKCFDTRVTGTRKCADCSAEISARATRCKACSAKHTSNRRCPNKPSKEELEKMLGEMLQKDIIEKIGVDKSTLIKWKREYGIALRKCAAP